MSGRGWTLCVDGYNVIKCDAELAALPLEQARRMTVGLAGTFRYPDPVGERIVVFDAPHQAEGAVRHYAGAVLVVFASGSADAEIQRRLRRAGPGGRCVVVTDDRAIRDTARDHGHRTLRVRAFLERTRERGPGAQAKRPRPAGDAAREKLAVDPAERAKIEQELRKRWLDSAD